MLEKYRATIHGNTIVWDGNVPDDVANKDSVDVYVTVVDKPAAGKLPNGARAAAA